MLACYEEGCIGHKAGTCTRTAITVAVRQDGTCRCTMATATNGPKMVFVARRQDNAEGP